ncbi:MAG: ABC-type dipeptide transporter, periplasmic component [Gammaproteobacteria bacterium]|nr:ABC-type dipeptide transporter, periplasmic component [Gammaproteobacteria bacterium]
MTKRYYFILLICLCFFACDNSLWNSPQTEKNYAENIRYGSFAASPKTLDPAESYTIDENMFLAQIYEPPLQYHYLKRPYTLIPRTAAYMPEVRYWNQKNEPLPKDASANDIAYTTYDITIQPNILYQPHPAFALAENGQHLYHALTPEDLKHITKLKDFPKTGTRELIAEDYVYQIKRLAHPNINSPILDLMSRYILGLSDFPKTLREAYNTTNKANPFFDLRKYHFAGVQVIDKYTYRITLKGKYQQFIYWLSMPFFAPIPWEADAFYSQKGMKEKNLNFNWQPIGTGPYYLAQNNPNKEMVLERNLNFHAEYFPTEGMAGDKEKGYLKNAGQKLPFVDRYVFTLEKEVIPRWNKFLQGYYDQSAISSDNYGEAIQLNQNKKPEITESLKRKGIRLQTSTDLSVFYFGFNMLDKVVGGNSDHAQKLRQAINIAIDQSEYISIFLNGRGMVSQSPIPPGIFGYASPKQGYSNPYLYERKGNVFQRKSIQAAKKLLIEAGYPEGRDQKTGKPLMIRFDSTTTSPADQDRFIWLRKQFEKLGIELDVEITDSNRFQEKMRNGDAQFFMYGWTADYPDPENFLFLFYSRNGQVKYEGVNATNYENPAYDKLFEQMQQMPNNQARFDIIQKMIGILRKDTPWVGEMFTESLTLSQQWLDPYKPNSVTSNVLKYQRIDPQKRIAMIQEWNRPVLWPVILIALILFLLILPAIIGYRRKMHSRIYR